MSSHATRFSKTLSLFSGLVYNSKEENAKITFGFPNEIPDAQSRTIFLRQQILGGGVRLSILFDNDCGKLVVKKSVVERLKGIGRSKQTLPDPLEQESVDLSKPYQIH